MRAATNLECTQLIEMIFFQENSSMMPDRMSYRAPIGQPAHRADRIRLGTNKPIENPIANYNARLYNKCMTSCVK